MVTGIHVNEPGNGGLELGVIRTALDLSTAGFHHTVRLLSQIEWQATDTTARVHFVLKHYQNTLFNLKHIYLIHEMLHNQTKELINKNNDNG